MGKLMRLPVIVNLSKAYETFKQRQDELTKYKINFLFNEAYRNFYEKYLILHTQRIGKSVDFHPHFYAVRSAKEAALDVIISVAEKGKINQLYQRRIKELKK